MRSSRRHNGRAVRNYARIPSYPGRADSVMRENPLDGRTVSETARNRAALGVVMIVLGASTIAISAWAWNACSSSPTVNGVAPDCGGIAVGVVLGVILLIIGIALAVASAARGRRTIYPTTPDPAVPPPLIQPVLVQQTIVQSTGRGPVPILWEPQSGDRDEVFRVRRCPLTADLLGRNSGAPSNSTREELPQGGAVALLFVGSVVASLPRDIASPTTPPRKVAM